jgi:peptidoglycan hydrolase CwlO-like protein
MKDNGLLVLVISACIISAVCLCWRAGSSGEAAKVRNEPSAVDNRDAKITGLERKIESVSLEVAAQSNRADVADSKCAEEKDMNEQLRKQIEKMIGEEIVLKAETEKKKQEVNTTVERAKAEMEDLKNRLLDMEKEKKGRGTDLESVRKDMGQTEPDTAGKPAGK